MSPTSYQAALPRSQVADYRYFSPFRQSSLAFDNRNADRAEPMLNSLQSSEENNYDIQSNMGREIQTA